MTSTRHTVPRNDGPRADARDRSSDDAYLDAAREAILAVGWSRTTLTDIARRAGVSRMTLYRRWPDTGTLLADLMTREWGQVVEAAAVAVGAPDDTRQRITRSVLSTVRSLRSSELLRRIVEVDPDVLLPYLLQRRGRSQQGLLDVLSAHLETDQREGVVRRGDVPAMARAILLACHGFALSAHTMADGPDPLEHDLDRLDDELGHLLDRFLEP